jgi:hypothetical protein
LKSEDVRQTYIKPYDKAWSPVRYAAVDGYAVFEGCIILGTVQQMEKTLQTLRDNPALLANWDESLGVVIRGVQYRWPDRTIPYLIEAGLPKPERVHKAIAHWHEHTQIKLRPREASDDDYVVFVPGGGCASAVGRQGARQEIILSPACTVGNVSHEIGHTVGLWHEQSRSDRDEHIDIVWQNIHPSYRHNFEQHIEDGVDIVEYDYGSIMHYPETAFAIDTSQPTIKPRDANAKIGQRDALSERDIRTVAAMYP